MTPAVRWAIGIALLVVAGALWMWWKPADKPAPPPPVVAAPPPAPVAAPAPPPAPKLEPLNATVYFDFDRSELRAADSSKLEALAAKLKDRKYAKVTVIGHADRLGEAPHNDALSRKRAEAAVAYLRSKGIDPARSSAEGKGKLATATCKDMGREHGSNVRLVTCLQEDRRVDIAIVD